MSLTFRVEAARALLLKSPTISLNGGLGEAFTGPFVDAPQEEIGQRPIIGPPRMWRWDGVEHKSLDAVEVRFVMNRYEILREFNHVRYCTISAFDKHNYHMHFRTSTPRNPHFSGAYKTYPRTALSAVQTTGLFPRFWVFWGAANIRFLRTFIG